MWLKENNQGYCAVMKLLLLSYLHGSFFSFDRMSRGDLLSTVKAF